MTGQDSTGGKVISKKAFVICYISAFETRPQAAQLNAQQRFIQIRKIGGVAPS